MHQRATCQVGSDCGCSRQVTTTQRRCKNPAAWPSVSLARGARFARARHEATASRPQPIKLATESRRCGRVRLPEAFPVAKTQQSCQDPSANSPNTRVLNLSGCKVPTTYCVSAAAQTTSGTRHQDATAGGSRKMEAEPRLPTAKTSQQAKPSAANASCGETSMVLAQGLG